MVNPTTPSVAYLLQPTASLVQGIRFTSGTSSTLGSAVSTGSVPIGGGCPTSALLQQLYVLNRQTGSVTVYTTSQENLIETAQVNSLGSPSGISICP